MRKSYEVPEFEVVKFQAMDALANGLEGDLGIMGEEGLSDGINPNDYD